MKKKINFKKRPIICLTSYNKFFAEIADQFCDIVLVGDSLGMAYYGDTSTRSVSLNDMIRHAKSVRSGVKKALMVVDMPYGTCKNPLLAKKNALRIIKETKCDAVKLEGGKEIKHIIQYLIKNKINVMGHIGLLPQKVQSKKDYKIKGINSAEKNKILNDLKNIQEAGVFAIVLEAVKNETAKEVMKLSKVPIIGIGASKKCDGQILVLEDMLGMFKKVPKFVKKYSNLRGYIKKAVKEYAKDIKNRKFPTKNNIY
ncbi:MAG: 3-methyl-2-oxobutanoate hydroxymethyltransferase [Pseudomonadota bacterium]|nr:3-methyl-2-oxobutanoate hydroxymethyltransferase [Pseudomonadota bacterium]